MGPHRSLIVPIVFALAASCVAQAVQRKQLITSLGGGGGFTTIHSTTDSLAGSGISTGSVTFGFAYALGDRWSVGIHYDRIGSDRTGNSIELMRFTTFLLEGTYRPWIGQRAAFEARLAIGPSVMALLPIGQRSPLKATNNAASFGVRYLHMISGGIGGFIGLEHTVSNGVNITDYEGRPITNPANEQVHLDWNSQRANAGLFVRF